MRSKLIAALAPGLALGLFVAQGVALADDENDGAKADPRLGEAVNRICFPRNIRNWRSIKGEDNVLLLEEGVNDWYRVELTGPCNSSALRFTQKIALESRPSGGCITRGDTITLLDSTGFDRRCVITQMNEWDEDAKAPDESDEGDES